MVKFPINEVELQLPVKFGLYLGDNLHMGKRLTLSTYQLIPIL
jgi:hypothetical protein